MRKLRIIIVVSILVLILLVGGYFLFRYLKPTAAGILIETTPAASVFINGAQVGRTPYEANQKPGEIIIKLVPESFEKPLVPYETKVTLVSGVKTIVRREFGESLDTSSGEIVSFEKQASGETSLSIVTIPDVAEISIDGVTRGFAPYKTSTITPQEHEVVIKLPGFKEKKLLVRTYEGYKLTALVNLSPSEEVMGKESGLQPVEEEEVEIEVEILSTPTGFLRVRKEPSTLGEEVGRVEPGERYLLLEEDEETGWFKIEYEEGSSGQPAKSGWVSNQYAKKLGGDGSSQTPSPTPSPTPKSSG